MRRELEQRPVDTKVLRENFRVTLQKKMNKLMKDGYVPIGGVSTHMNTHTRPVLGMDAQEFTQTMVKYTSVEVWIKESEADHTAYSDEHSHESLATVIGSLEKGIAKDIKLVEELEDLLSVPSDHSSQVGASFFQRMKDSIGSAVVNSRKTRLLKAKERIITNKGRLEESIKQSAELSRRLDAYYGSNPSVTRDVLLNSK